MHTQGQIKSIAGKAGRLKAKIPFFPQKSVFSPKNSNLDFAKITGFLPYLRVFSPIFLALPPGFLAQSPGILAHSPGRVFSPHVI